MVIVAYSVKCSTVNRENRVRIPPSPQKTWYLDLSFYYVILSRGVTVTRLPLKEHSRGSNPFETTYCPLAERLLHRPLKATPRRVYRFESCGDNFFDVLCNISYLFSYNYKTLTSGVIGNTSDFGSEESEFEPLGVNKFYYYGKIKSWTQRKFLPEWWMGWSCKKVGKIFYR